MKGCEMTPPNDLNKFEEDHPVLFEDSKKKHPSYVVRSVALVLAFLLFFGGILGVLVTIHGMLLIRYAVLRFYQLIHPSYRIPIDPEAPKYNFIWTVPVPKKLKKKNESPKSEYRLHPGAGFLKVPMPS